MIKRIAALFLIVTATAVFLTDYFIPHHHHGSTICFDSSHCSSDAHADEFPTPSSHNHGSDDDCGSCKLKQALMIPTVYQYNELINMVNFAPNILTDLVPVNINITLLPELVTAKNYNYGKYLLILKSSEEGSIASLRAPPLA